jgi:hypothetical protein
MKPEGLYSYKVSPRLFLAKTSEPRVLTWIFKSIKLETNWKFSFAEDPSFKKLKCRSSKRQADPSF